MKTRREVIKGGLGLAGIIAAGRAPAALVRSMVAARTAAWATAGGWENPYVTEGLVAMWDGEWNESGGVHNGELDGWNDLIGTNHFTSLNRRGAGKATVINSNNYYNGSPEAAVIENGIVLGLDFFKTVEIVFRADSVVSSSQPRIIFTPGGSGVRYRQGVVSLGRTSDTSTPLLSFCNYHITSDNNRAGVPCALGIVHSASCSFEDHSAAIWHDVTLDGVAHGVDDCDFSQNNLDPYSYLAIGGRSGSSTGQIYSDGYGVSGAVYCVRLYDRVLTEAKVSANYAVDKARFGL